MLTQMKPPQNFKIWEPDNKGQPRRWYKPWIQSTTPAREDPSSVGEKDEKDEKDEPILRMAASAEHPAENSKLTCQGATLLGYFWDLENYALTKNKNSKINLYPARRGLRPSWGEISEAEDLLPLHRKKPFTQRQALAIAHNLYDPISSAPYLSASLKFMYRYLIISTSLAEDKEGTQCNFDKALTDAFVREHLQPAVALAINTKRRLAQRRTWRLDPCIPYSDIRITLECVVDGAWGSLLGSACLCYLIQRYTFMGSPRVSIY